MDPDALAVLIVVGVVAIVIGAPVWWAVARARRQKRAHLAGPGAPTVPPAADPWRRFAAALAAPYAAHEWESSRRRLSPEAPAQMFFGYGVGLPASGVVQLLAGTWKVRDERSALLVMDRALTALAQSTRAVALADPRLLSGELRERLVAAGAPRRTIDSLDPEWIDRVRETEGHGASGIHDLERAKNELAFQSGRVADLVRLAAFAGCIDAVTADSAGDLCAAAVITGFRSWHEYADRFLAGLYASGTGADRQRTGSLDWLKFDPASPWAQVAWPA